MHKTRLANWRNKHAVQKSVSLIAIAIGAMAMAGQDPPYGMHHVIGKVFHARPAGA
jgi:hypothetical protein